MAHDVLISYSSRDKLQADAICNRLESRGIRCWIAPRDVGLGEYAEKIVEAIEAARIMVLVYSANADESPQVRREVERAVSKGTTIVPVRIEDHEMSKAFELYIGSVHWLDAITPPLDEHIDLLADQLEALLGAKGPADGTPPSDQPAAAASPAPQASPTPPPTAAAQPAASAGRGKLLGGAVAVGLIVLLLFWFLGRGSEEGTAGEAQGADIVAEDAATATVDMTFENALEAPVRVYWVNDGAEELYATLEPGEEWVVATYPGHEWLTRSVDNEEEVTECVAGASATSCVISVLNGYEVAWVAWEEPGTGATGTYQQTGPGSWEERDGDGALRFLLSEEARDEWSVYLRDEGRRVSIQLDLWTDRVMYSDANAPEPRVLYAITDASD